MASRRMYSKDVVCTDKFLSLPIRSQALYFHLGLMADDDGFVTTVDSIRRQIRCQRADLQTLVDQGYLFALPDGLYLIRDWRINNKIRKDRYHVSRQLYNTDILVTVREDTSYDCVVLKPQAGDPK